MSLLTAETESHRFRWKWFACWENLMSGIRKLEATRMWTNMPVGFHTSIDHRPWKYVAVLNAFYSWLFSEVGQEWETEVIETLVEWRCWNSYWRSFSDPSSSRNDRSWSKVMVLNILVIRSTKKIVSERWPHFFEYGIGENEKQRQRQKWWRKRGAPSRFQGHTFLKRRMN